MSTVSIAFGLYSTVVHNILNCISTYCFPAVFLVFPVLLNHYPSGVPLLSITEDVAELQGIYILDRYHHRGLELHARRH